MKFIPETNDEIRENNLQSNLQLFQLNYRNLIFFSSYQVIFVLSQQILLPTLQGNLNISPNEFQNILIIYFISYLIFSTIYIRGLEYTNTNTEQLKRINTISYQFIDQIKKLDYKYDFNKLLSCNKDIEILKCFITNPKQFLDDYYKCVKQLIQKNLEFISSYDKHEFIRDIPQLYISILNKNCILDLKEIVDKIKKFYLKELIHISFIINEEKIDQQQFLNLINKINNTYLEIKINNLKELGNINLRKNIKNFINENEIILPEYQNRINHQIRYDNIKSYFEATTIYHLANVIKNDQAQDMNVDSALREFQYNPLTKPSWSTQIIHSIIEKQEDIIVNKDNDDQYGKIKINNKLINMNLRYAIDKDYHMIQNKISRKNDMKTQENIPWCVKLIKDFKRMSIIFKTEEEIYLYFENKKKIFGSNFDKQISSNDRNIMIRIYEIKNGFYGLDSNNENGDQRDLKIIQEIAIQSEDTAFMLECQINLEKLIFYKKSDHIIYDFLRAENDFKTIKKLKENNLWMEGKIRPVLEMIRLVIICLAAAVVCVSTGYVLNNFNLNYDIIRHANNIINIKFIEGLYKDNICQSIDNKNHYCIGDTKLNYQLQGLKNQQFNFLQSNGFSLIGIDNNNNPYTKNLESYESFTQYSHITSVQQNNQMICQHRNSSLYCNHLKFYPKSISIRTDGLCASVRDLLKCVGDNFQGSNDIPEDLQKGASIISSGVKFNCASIPSLFLCWGLNFQGTLDIPDEFQNGVDIVSAGEYHVCAGKGYVIKCWGSDVELDIPNEISNGCSLLDVQNGVACAADFNGFLQCWGNRSESGQLDIPNDAKSLVSIVSVGVVTVCAQNAHIHCWGSDQTQIIRDAPRQMTNVILLKNNSIACTSEENEFLCWGGVSDNSRIPEFQREGVELLAVGDQNNVCVSFRVYIECFGNDLQTTSSQFPADVKENWQYSSIQENIKSISQGTSMKLIYKDIVYNEQDDQSITTIPRNAINSSNFKASQENACANTNGNLQCWGPNIQINENPLLSLYSADTILQAVGRYHACAYKYYHLECWSSPQFNQILDMPLKQTSGQLISYLSTNITSICIGSDAFLVCWGSQDAINRIPIELTSGVDGLTVSMFFACATQVGQLTCWGTNQSGELDIPEAFRNDRVDFIEAGNRHICALNESEFLCWGNDSNQFLALSTIPNHLKTGIDKLVVNSESNCVHKNNEWFCWGGDSLNFMQKVKDLMEFDNVKEQSMTNDYEICINQTDYVQCQSNNDQSGEFDINIYDSLMCMQVLSGRTYLCYADGKFPNKFRCIDISKLSDSEKLNYEYTSDASIAKLSCGTSHGCVMFENGEAHCFGGSIDQNEADLPSQMKIGVKDIRAGHYSTCIINTNNIQCIGNEIETNIEKFSLLNLEGLNNFINL